MTSANILLEVLFIDNLSSELKETAFAIIIVCFKIIEPRCMINETKFHVGDEFRDGFFNWICLDTGRWVTG